MPHVQLFVTCLVDTFRPQSGEALVHVLRRLGVDVSFPAGQTCCGQPAFNAGLRADARRMAEQTIRVFEADPAPLILPSGSCAAMLKQGYPELFADDPAWLPRAEALAARTFEFTQYLVDVLGVTDVGARWEGDLTYHASCHLTRHLGVEKQPLALLAAVKGARLLELPAASDCCGFGGVFSVEQPEISAEMLQRKIASLEALPGELTLVVADTGCILHLAGGLHRQGKKTRVVHIAEVLDSH
ncbi:MAG: lactate utilization iron-sulfur protein LutA [Anaerolineales bacterium]